MSAIIEFKDIKKVYKTGYQEVNALSGISLALERGEFAAVMGPSGSGKSTLMNIAGCLDTPTEGSYKLDGRDVTGLLDSELARCYFQKYNFTASLQ